MSVARSRQSRIVPILIWSVFAALAVLLVVFNPGGIMIGGALAIILNVLAAVVFLFSVFQVFMHVKCMVKG